MVKILVADKLAEAGIKRLQETEGVSVDVKTGLGEDELAGVVRDYDGMAIRSAVKVTAKVLAEPGKLRAIARAGVGVDNVDLEAATQAGILVMNTPDANTIATAEHTMAMMLAMARRIPEAHQHVKSGQWKRSEYVGTQLSGKTLGLIGFGRVGRAVAQRALAMEMRVLAYDPFYSGSSALEGRVTIVEDLDELLTQADYLSIHATLTDQTRGMIGTEQLAKMKDGARIVNCARGGIVEEAALAEALRSGKIAGAAIDVYSTEPPKGNPLLDAPNVVLAPHLGASTREAQVAVSVEAANALIDYLLHDVIRNAVNVAGLPADMTARDRAYLDLCRRMGAILSPLCAGGIEKVSITTHGESLAPICATLARQALVDLLSPHFETRLNLINAEDFAKRRGITVEHTASTASQDFTDNVVLCAQARNGRHCIEGTVFLDGLPRILSIDGYRMDMVPEGTMVLIFNDDKPGVIGIVGTTFGQHAVNIADLTVSRQDDAAMMVLKTDGTIPPEAIAALQAKRPPIRMVRTVQLPAVTAEPQRLASG